MAGDLLTAAQDDDLVDEALHDHLLEAVAGRHRVVVAAIAHQRRRRDAGRPLLAGLQRHGGQIQEGLQIGGKTLADRLGMASGSSSILQACWYSSLGPPRRKGLRSAGLWF